MLPQKEKPFDSNTSVFVGRLPKVMDEQQVKDSFVSCGPIQRILMQKYPDGKSKGSCFIEFESNAAATKACARDGSVIHSQHIHVNMAEKKPKKNKYKHLPTNQQKKLNNAYCIYVGKLSGITVESTLAKCFGKCGKVMRINIPLWKGSNKRRGFAIIEFASIAAVGKAVELDGITVDGKKIMIMPLEDVIKPKGKKNNKKKNGVKREDKEKQMKEESEDNNVQMEEDENLAMKEESEEDLQEFGELKVENEEDDD